MLDTTGPGTIAESGQNAISTLLLPPIVRTGLQPHTAISTTGFKAPTQRDIPPVTLTNIPHIEAKAFQPYLAQVGLLYEAFQRAKQEDQGAYQLFRRDRKQTKTEDLEAVLATQLQHPIHSRAASTTSGVSSPSEPPTPIRRSGGQRRQHAVTPLSTIPTVYSDEDFHLENPRTFDVVSEKSDIIRDPNAAPGRKTLASNAILQEKLSWYMDTVEIHLVTSISTASKSFFSALGSLRELHSEAAESVQRIQKLRKDLAKLDKEMVQGGLKVVNLRQRKNNVRQLAQAIMQLELIVSNVRHCDDMVRAGEVDRAIDALEGVEKLMAGKHMSLAEEQEAPLLPLRDLRQLKALEGASEDLRELRFRIGKGYETRFLDILLEDIRRHVNSTQADITLQRWGTAFSRPRPGLRRAPSMFPSYMTMDPQLRINLQTHMTGLSRAQHTVAAATTFRALVLKEMKTLIRKQLPSSNDDDAMSSVSASTYGGRRASPQEKSLILAQNLRALDAADAYAMLSKIYTNVSEGLRRLSVQVKIVLDITSTMDQPAGWNIMSPSRSPERGRADNLRSPSPSAGRRRAMSNVQAEVQQALDLSSLLGQAVDMVQTQITKVIKVRSQQVAEYSLHDFLRFFTLNRLFADECEAISGSSGSALKSIVDAQIKDFVSHFTNKERHHVVEVMDGDKWDAKDFSDLENAILSRVMEGSTSDAHTWTTTSYIWQASGESNGTNGKLTNGDAVATAKVRSAVIDEQKFILPESAIAILRSIDMFQHLVVGLPSMSQEVATSLIDTLKLFNSRTSQLILGAGATRSAGLKNITTKHLALSSQALSFVIALIPYIREFFRRHLPSSSSLQIMTEFDRVKRLFQEHQSGIHEKLVDIMSSRASTHVNAMKKIDWQQAALNKSVPVSPYVEVLTKETGTLQKVLAKHLSEMSVTAIMQPVFASYREQWSKSYQEVTVRSLAEKERMLADAEYFNSRISKLDGAGDLGEHILNVVKAKPVVSDPTAGQREEVDKPRSEPVGQVDAALPAPAAANGQS
jgi:vacuolar protein sorting-associated protein 54